MSKKKQSDSAPMTREEWEAAVLSALVSIATEIPHLTEAINDLNELVERANMEGDE